MSDTKHQIEELPQPEQELTPEQADEVAGGAAVDYLLTIDGIKGESSDKKTTTNTYRGRTTVNDGTLV